MPAQAAPAVSLYLRRRRFDPQVAEFGFGHNSGCTKGSVITFHAKMSVFDVIDCLEAAGVGVVLLEAFGFRGNLPSLLPLLQAEQEAFNAEFPPPTSLHPDFPRGWIMVMDVARNIPATDPSIHLLGVSVFDENGSPFQPHGSFVEREDGLPIPHACREGAMGWVQYKRFPIFGFLGKWSFGGVELYMPQVKLELEACAISLSQQVIKCSHTLFFVLAGGNP